MDQKIIQKLHYMFDDELEHHPESRLIDLYKLYVQSALGPGHIIKNSDTARAYLSQELQNYQKYISKFDTLSKNPYIVNLKAEHKRKSDLETAEQRESFIICPCLILNCDVWLPLARYSLQLLADRVIPFDDFFDAFIESANEISLKTENYAYVDEYIFIEHWNASIPFLETKKIDSFERDCETIKKLISEKQYLVRHSQAYNDAYKPSYRIINKSFLEKYNEIVVEKYFKK